jgi:hypothetical protein
LSVNMIDRVCIGDRAEYRRGHEKVHDSSNTLVKPPKTARAASCEAARYTMHDDPSPG